VCRQYSLCGDPDDRSTYTVAVLREAGGRGGSAEIHDTALVGKKTRLHGPRNRFRLEDAPAYVFVAGGIGITPILAMIREVAARGARWSLHYGGRSSDTMAFTTEVRELARRSGGSVELLAQDVDV
jgi:ferredoxin-NADP reductase